MNELEDLKPEFYEEFSTLAVANEDEDTPFDSLLVTFDSMDVPFGGLNTTDQYLGPEIYIVEDLRP